MIIKEQSNKPRALNKFDLAALETSEIVAKKNMAYGDAVLKSGAMLELLYPNGIQPHQYTDAAAIIRVLDKLVRIATDNDPFGEDPWGDINGYSLLRKVQRAEQKGETK